MREFPGVLDVLGSKVKGIALAVVLRIISRRLVLRKLGADDWWMLVGMVSLQMNGLQGLS